MGLPPCGETGQLLGRSNGEEADAWRSSGRSLDSGILHDACLGD